MSATQYNDDCESNSWLEILLASHCWAPYYFFRVQAPSVLEPYLLCFFILCDMCGCSLYNRHSYIFHKEVALWLSGILCEICLSSLRKWVSSYMVLFSSGPNLETARFPSKDNSLSFSHLFIFNPVPLCFVCLFVCSSPGLFVVKVIRVIDIGSRVTRLITF